MQKRRVRVRIRGMVQGVCFRAFARDAAIKEGVTGWVRNLRDGSVEALLEGDADRVERMIAWCHQGSPYGFVDHVEVKEEAYEGTFDRFDSYLWKVKALEQVKKLWEAFINFLITYDSHKISQLFDKLKWEEVVTNPYVWLIGLPYLGYMLVKKRFKTLILLFSLAAFVYLMQGHIPALRRDSPA